MQSWTFPYLLLMREYMSKLSALPTVIPAKAGIHWREREESATPVYGPGFPLSRE